MTLPEAQKIFPRSFIQQIKELLINGNYGDIVMCEQALDIIKYFRDANPDLKICISTNGGARNDDFWKALAGLKTEVFFCLDGLENTHSLYRKNTVFSTVINNAKTFIASGGRAYWKFVVFDHNQHELEEAELRSKDLGFIGFVPIRTSRTKGPVFDSRGEFQYHIGPDVGPVEIDELMYQMRPKPLHLILQGPDEKKTITCQVQRDLSIYVASNGDVFPCCFLGYHPNTFRKLEPWHSINSQLVDLIWENNALRYDLEHCMIWFEKIKDSWNQPDFLSGLVKTCHNTCGK